MKIRIRGNEAVIEKGNDTASAFIKGCKGKIKVKSPFGSREIQLVDKFKTKPKSKGRRKVKA